MAEFASHGVANAGLTTGIIGTALGVLNGGLGNILNTGNGHCNHVCSENMAVTRYELGQEQRIAQLESQIALRDANIYSDQKLVEVYKDLSARINGLEDIVNAQAVYNATNTATINCIQGQVAQLFGLTKTIIPITNVCPQPMPQYNSWTAPTTTT